MAGEDIRVKKTKYALVTTLLSMLEKQSFQKISVNDICKEALVSRSTFYVHFEDKYELLHYCIQELRTRIEEQTCGMEPAERIKQVLENGRAHANVFRNVFMDDVNNEVQKMFLHYFSENLFDVLREQEHNGRLLGAPAEFLAMFYSSAIAVSIQMWMMGDYTASLEEFAQYLYTPVAHLLED